MLTLTEQAAALIKSILDESEAGPEAGLRISGAASDDGSASLEFSLAPSPVDGDEVVSDDGATLFLDGIAATVLADKTLDAEAHDDHLHFSLTEQEEP
jgi:iron-sulfur cluster assembly protein